VSREVKPFKRTGKRELERGEERLKNGGEISRKEGGKRKDGGGWKKFLGSAAREGGSHWGGYHKSDALLVRKTIRGPELKTAGTDKRQAKGGGMRGISTALRVEQKEHFTVQKRGKNGG